MAKKFAKLSEIIGGGSVVCIASGPSLTAEDVEMVKQWRGDRRSVIVANATFRAAPWADAMYAMDRKFWDVYRSEIVQVFQGLKYCGTCLPATYGAMYVMPHEMTTHGNSGAACVSLAVHCGAKRVIMLGFDCQHDGKKTHWHDDHPSPLGNARTVNKWPAKFRALAARIGAKAEVVNASRRTALTMFPRVDLAEALC